MQHVILKADSTVNSPRKNQNHSQNFCEKVERISHLNEQESKENNQGLSTGWALKIQKLKTEEGEDSPMHLRQRVKSGTARTNYQEEMFEHKEPDEHIDFESGSEVPVIKLKLVNNNNDNYNGSNEDEVGSPRNIDFVEYMKSVKSKRGNNSFKLPQYKGSDKSGVDSMNDSSLKTKLTPTEDIKSSNGVTDSNSVSENISKTSSINFTKMMESRNQ